MSHLRGFHTKSLYGYFFHGGMHFNFDMLIAHADNLSILTTLPFNHMTLHYIFPAFYFKQISL